MKSFEEYIHERISIEIVDSFFSINDFYFYPSEILKSIAPKEFESICYDLDINLDSNNIELRENLDPELSLNFSKDHIDISGNRFSILEVIKEGYPEMLDVLKAGFEDYKKEELGKNEQTLKVIKEEKASGIHALKSEIVLSYPSPISFSFHNYLYASSSESERYSYLKDCWESIIYVLFSIVLSEYLQNKVWRAFKDIKISDIYDFSISKKLGVMKKLIEFQDPLTTDFISNEVLSLTIIEKLIKLNKDRNNAFHNQTQSEAILKRRNSENLNKIIDIVRELTFLKDLKYSLFQGVDKLFSNKIFFDEFVGHSWNKKIIKKQFKKKVTPPLVGCNVLLRYKQQVLCVSPFLHFKLREGFNEHRLAYLKSKKNGILSFEIVGASGESAQFNEKSSSFSIIEKLEREKNRISTGKV
ncbi:hypothetical protein [Halobacteriovorax sp. HLS]|uniref:hypothetical protein n=1 Tax=Halobacteriovorax sp. HLS TaxID=2234000 RepID=UPI000FD9010C|nr:hypothetical protein [Halobacteriovorax sp. HLS]